LRLVTTYPWLLEVADARFAQRAASAKVVMEAGKILGNAIFAFTPATTITYNPSTPLHQSDEGSVISINNALQPQQLAAQV